MSSNNDDSRPLDDDETTTLTIAQIISRYADENIGVVHGQRFTFVHGYSTTNGGRVLLDCYGDEIPGGYGLRNATVPVVIR